MRKNWDVEGFMSPVPIPAPPLPSAPSLTDSKKTKARKDPTKILILHYSQSPNMPSTQSALSQTKHVYSQRMLERELDVRSPHQQAPSKKKKQASVCLFYKRWNGHKGEVEILSSFHMSATCNSPVSRIGEGEGYICM